MKFFIVIISSALIVWGCGSSSRMASTGNYADSDSRQKEAVSDNVPAPAKSVPGLLMPESMPAQGQTRNQPEQVATQAPREDLGPVITTKFSPAETQHVRFAFTSPQPGELFTLPLSNLQNEFCYPAEGNVISNYGMRNGSMHTGVDIKANHGDTIRAVLSGVVRMSKVYSGYGNIVVIRHPCGVETLYGHNSRNLVVVNQQVEAGQAIALAGRTGRATTEHLHFEVRVGGEHLDPSLVVDHRARCVKADTLFIFNKAGELKIMSSSDTKEIFASGSKDKKVSMIAKNVPPSAETASAEPEQRPVAVAAQAKGGTYSVVKGDVLSTIASRHGTSVEELCRLNGIGRNDKLRIGQRLILPSGGASSMVADVAVERQPVREPVREVAVQTQSPVSAESAAEYHIMGRGETLGKVASRYGISVAELCRINSIDNPDRVNAGDRLRLRGEAPSPAAPKAKPSTANQADTHTVRKGDTLRKIASANGITVAALCSMNGIEENSILQIGQRIRLK